MNSSKYEEVQLGDVVEEITVGYVGNMTKEYIDYGVPFLRSLNVEPYNINLNSIKYVSLEFHQKLKKSTLNQGDVVIVRTGKPGTCAVIPNWIGEVNCSDLVIIRPGENIDSNYLEAYINTLATSHIDAYTVGAVQQHFNVSSAKKIKMLLPPLNEQKKIGNISKLINDKISNNNNLIDNLEKISSLLFKRWFINFEFPNEQDLPYRSSGGEMVESELGEIPRGWNLKSLDSIAEFKNGLAMQKYRPNENEDSLPVLKIRELNQGYTNTDGEKCSINIPEKVKVRDGDVIFSWSGTLMVKLWAGGNAGLNQHLFKVTSEEFSKWFYYLWTKHHLREFIAIAETKATTMGHIKRTHLAEAKVLIPDKKTFSEAENIFAPIINQIINLSIENKNLIGLRDNLLPKLLSGEIEIPDESVVERL